MHLDNGKPQFSLLSQTYPQRHVSVWGESWAGAPRVWGANSAWEFLGCTGSGPSSPQSGQLESTVSSGLPALSSYKQIDTHCNKVAQITIFTWIYDDPENKIAPCLTAEESRIPPPLHWFPALHQVKVKSTVTQLWNEAFITGFYLLWVVERSIKTCPLMVPKPEVKMREARTSCCKMLLAPSSYSPKALLKKYSLMVITHL